MSIQQPRAAKPRKSKRALIITDSLGFPRKIPEFVGYENTYIALLKDEFMEYDFIHVGRGGGTIKDLFKAVGYYQGTIEPSIVLVHCGIVDCAPRALTRSERKRLKRVPVLGSIVLNFIRMNAKRIRAKRKVTYTSVEDFRKYINRFEAAFKNLFWIEILPAISDYESILPGIEENIARYNESLRKNNTVCTKSFLESDISSDFHHLNLQGHKKMFFEICKIFQNHLQ